MKKMQSIKSEVCGIDMFLNNADDTHRQTPHTDQTLTIWFPDPGEIKTRKCERFCH